jgi:hypothetical protein
MLPQRALGRTKKYFLNCSSPKCNTIAKDSGSPRWTELDGNVLVPKKLPFNMETRSQGGLRYFVIGDAGTADLDNLAKLFKAAS